MRTTINLMVALAAYLALHFPFNYRDARATFASSFHNVDGHSLWLLENLIMEHLCTRNLPFCCYRFGRINRPHFVPVLYEIFMRKCLAGFRETFNIHVFHLAFVEQNSIACDLFARNLSPYEIERRFGILTEIIGR